MDRSPSFQNTGQVITSFPLTSEYKFEHHFATFDRDKRALEGDVLRYTRNKKERFPSNEQMVYDAEEDLKQCLNPHYALELRNDA